jgi:hypothetical protein
VAADLGVDTLECETLLRRLFAVMGAATQAEAIAAAHRRGLLTRPPTKSIGSGEWLKARVGGEKRDVEPATPTVRRPAACGGEGSMFPDTKSPMSARDNRGNGPVAYSNDCTRTQGSDAWRCGVRKLVVVESLSLEGIVQAPGHPNEDGRRYVHKCERDHHFASTGTPQSVRRPITSAAHVKT